MWSARRGEWTGSYFDGEVKEYSRAQLPDYDAFLLAGCGDGVWCTISGRGTSCLDAQSPAIAETMLERPVTPISAYLAARRPVGLPGRACPQPYADGFGQSVGTRGEQNARGNVTRWSRLFRSAGRFMDAHLSSHHRDTIEKIFSHPTSGNIEWREVLSLLEYLGTTTDERNGKFRVTLGPETEVLEAPRGKDIDEQMIVNLRRMLRQAGLAPDDGTPRPDERHRDHGDGRWGAPS
jgi:hypothetical protein